MFADVVELRDFYTGRTGLVARHLIRRHVRAIWPDLGGQRVLGLGYTTPYLRQFREEAERVMAFMPAQQGVLRWPPEGPNAVALSDEATLPLPDYSIDRVLLVHALEHTEQLRPLLEEIWRVLMGDGRLLVVVPNRRGVWARLERTPFGHGHPYSASQLSNLLREQMFLPMHTSHALFIPPTGARTVLATAPAWERIGTRWFSRFGGVVMMEAGKQVYALNRPLQAAANQRTPAVVPFPRVARPTGARRSRDS
jgi:SAM-dependent methyltransferase